MNNLSQPTKRRASNKPLGRGCWCGPWRFRVRCCANENGVDVAAAVVVAAQRLLWRQHRRGTKWGLKGKSHQDEEADQTEQNKHTKKNKQQKQREGMVC